VVVNENDTEIPPMDIYTRAAARFEYFSPLEKLQSEAKAKYVPLQDDDGLWYINVGTYPQPTAYKRDESIGPFTSEGKARTAGKAATSALNDEKQLRFRVEGRIEREVKSREKYEARDARHLDMASTQIRSAAKRGTEGDPITLNEGDTIVVSMDSGDFWDVWHMRSVWFVVTFDGENFERVMVDGKQADATTYARNEAEGRILLVDGNGKMTVQRKSKPTREYKDVWRIKRVSTDWEGKKYTSSLRIDFDEYEEAREYIEQATEEKAASFREDYKTSGLDHKEKGRPSLDIDSYVRRRLSDWGYLTAESVKAPVKKAKVSA
jgi:hypothetical protein